MKLNEGGASNAFFFYSGSERFIAKSCTKAEMDVLLDMASDYKTYLVDNPESFLTRILGAHRLRMYGTMFYFFVMENVLKRPDTSNAGDTPEWNTDNDNQTLLKYDIKGSSYNRNSAIPKNGQSVTCKYCNRKYSYQNPANRLRKYRRFTSIAFGSLTSDDPTKSWHPKSSLCCNRRGARHGSAALVAGSEETSEIKFTDQFCTARLDHVHSPNVVFKDNDLTQRLYLHRKDAMKTAKQITNDARFLCDKNIMDYSLLIGVLNVKVSLRQNENSRIDSSGALGSTLPELSSELVTDDSSFGEYELQSVACRREATHIEGPKFYYFGIIDILQKWDLYKRAEMNLKVIYRCEDNAALSCIEPEAYWNRFREKIYDILKVDIHESSEHASGV